MQLAPGIQLRLDPAVKAADQFVETVGAKMIPTFVEVTNPKTGSKDTYLNGLRRYVRGGILTPSYSNQVVRIPAMSGTNPGMSAPIPVEGPIDAHTEVKSINGQANVAMVGTGTISSAAAVVTGVGTKFITEVVVGDTIQTNGASQSVLSITSDTVLNTVANFAPALAASTAFAVQTPTSSDPENRLRVRIRDMAFNRQLMNAPVPVKHIFGSNTKPALLMESLLLQKNQMLQYQFFNYSTTAATSMSITNMCVKNQVEGVAQFSDLEMRIKGLLQRKTFLSPFWLTLDPLPTSEAVNQIPSSGTLRATLSNMTGSWLFLFMLYGHSVTSAGGGDTNEIFTIELFDQQTGRPFQSAPVTLNTALGTAANPYRLPWPIIVPPRQQITAKYTFLATGNTIDVFTTLGGVSLLTDSSAVLDPGLLEEAQRIYDATEPPQLRQATNY